MKRMHSQRIHDTYHRRLERVVIAQVERVVIAEVCGRRVWVVAARYLQLIVVVVWSWSVDLRMHT